MAARAIQFFTPGVPQVYYVGLLAGKNDVEAVERTGEKREINRHNFTYEEIETSLQTEVVQRLLKLIRFRNEYAAFDGEFKVLDSAKDEIRLSWQKDDRRCELFLDLRINKTIIEYLNDRGESVQYFV